jgi:hypothetical protein
MRPPLRLLLPAVGLACLALAPAASAAAPTFSNYSGPTSLVGTAGEPSVGFNPKTGATLFQSDTTTVKVTGFDGAGQATWTDVSDPFAVTSLDPILWTDRATGRSIESQLLLACSQAGYTDDDGATWNASQGCGIGTGVDHQTIGGGPFAPGGLPVPHTYPDAVYYCTQDGAEAAHCATSYDGGVTFGPGTIPYTAGQCPLLLHGHIKVGPDGTAYLPTADCDGHQALAESTDDGLTWKVEEVPGSTTQDQSDPSLGIGKSGTLYLGWQGADGTDLGNPTDPTTGQPQYFSDAWSEGHPYISVKRPGGGWQTTDLAALAGVKNIQFPEVVAGDDDRAAFAFLGTPTTGDNEAADFKGAWHLYVAYTYDTGQSWTVVDATPTDPVQRGCIWMQGGSSACRNLLDFNDITYDGLGRVEVAYADGCTGKCVTDANDYADKTSLGTIARQESGLGLLASGDQALSGATPVAPTTFSAKVRAPAATRVGDEGEVRDRG